jgi:hypothetical protein
MTDPSSGPITVFTKIYRRSFDCDAGSTRQVNRSPRVIRATFLPSTCHIYSSTLPDDYRALKKFAFSTRMKLPHMRFLFVGPEICLRLPSNSTSRWTPLPFSLVVPVIRARRRLSPPSHQSATTADQMALTRHALRTNKSGIQFYLYAAKILKV